MDHHRSIRIDAIFITKLPPLRPPRLGGGPRREGRAEEVGGVELPWKLGGRGVRGGRGVKGVEGWAREELF